MEDPIRFDLWGRPTEASRPWLVERLQSGDEGESRVEVLRRVSRANREGTAVRFAQGLGWAAALAEARAGREALASVEIYQQGYGPDDRSGAGFCRQHDLVYGGCLGCPVCGGWHER